MWPNMFIGCCAKNEINTITRRQVRENKMLLVVRDPWERLLSAYRDKLEATTGPDQVDLAWKHGKKVFIGFKNSTRTQYPGPMVIVPPAMLSLSPDYFPGKVWPAHGERLQKRRHCSIWTRCIQVSMFVPLLGLCSSIWTFQISLDCSYSLQIQKTFTWLIFDRKSAGAPMIVEVNWQS